MFYTIVRHNSASISLLCRRSLFLSILIFFNFGIVGRSFKIQQLNLSPIYPSVAIKLLKSVPISHPEKPHPSPIQKKIFPYIDTTGGETGLVQQPDKIVARFALTIYPYSLAHHCFFISAFPSSVNCHADLGPFRPGTLSRNPPSLSL